MNEMTLMKKRMTVTNEMMSTKIKECAKGGGVERRGLRIACVRESKRESRLGADIQDRKERDLGDLIRVAQLHLDP